MLTNTEHKAKQASAQFKFKQVQSAIRSFASRFRSSPRHPSICVLSFSFHLSLSFSLSFALLSLLRLFLSLFSLYHKRALSSKGKDERREESFSALNFRFSLPRQSLSSRCSFYSPPARTRKKKKGKWKKI